ncbi:MAG: phage head closure protein [Alphaproteobacteria bacterium]|nr:phage head closure protein [Alphaproteobacteria bacterium]
MNINALDHRLTIEEAWQTTDGGGGFTTDWQAIATDPVVFAAITQTGGGESPQAGKIEFTADCLITLRWRDDLRADQRLREGDAVYVITAIDDTDPAKTWLKIRATRRVL